MIQLTYKRIPQIVTEIEKIGYMDVTFWDSNGDQEMIRCLQEIQKRISCSYDITIGYSNPLIIRFHRNLPKG